VAQYPDIVPPQVTVSATYPGAGADVVETTVGQPIESRVIGVEDMLYMKSTSGADGSYKLTVTFAVGTDPDIATLNVQNRVSLALPGLPQEVSQIGVSVRKQSSALLQVIAISSTDPAHDGLFLSNYATINLLDALKRTPGVGDASLFGALDYSMRIVLDVDRLTSLGVTPGDVVAALKAQNVQAAIGRIGAQPMTDDPLFQLNLTTQGRLTDPAQFADVVLRADPDGSFPAHPRRGGGGARRQGLRRGRPLRRPADSDDRHLPAPRRQRARRRRRRQGGAGPALGQLPARHQLRHLSMDIQSYEVRRHPVLRGVAQRERLRGAR
jgi:multidrug efflux pump subunit AcrB